MGFSRLLPWMLAAGLAALIVHGPIGSAGGDADVGEARRALGMVTAALEAGDLSQLTALYAPDADHRDLAEGRRVRGAAAIGAFLDEAYGGGVGGSADVASFRLLTTDVAIAQLTIGNGGEWPPYLAALLRHQGDRWRLVATRAGGNPDTRARALPDAGIAD